MSFMRSLKRRIARLLVRLAQRMDSAGAAPSKLAADQAFEGLRLRYPGAPDHWLELVAARGQAQTSSSRQSGEVTGRREVSEVTLPRLGRPDTPFQDLIAPAIPRAAPMVRFGHHEPRTRVAVRFRSPPRTAALGPTSPTFPREERLEPLRRAPRGFASVRKVRVGPLVQFPPALPLSEPRDEPSFSARIALAGRAAPRFEGAVAPAREREAGVFPPPDPPPSRCSEWQAPEIVDRDHARDWADVTPASKRSHELSCLTSTPSPVSREIDFSSSPNPWPELPALEEDDRQSPPASCEDSRLAREQMGGRWSA